MINFPVDLIDFFWSIKVLRITGSKIESIKSEDLEGFNNLEELYMPSNALKSIKSDLFIHNKNLKIVDFRANNLENIGIGTFLNLKNLTWINLRENVNFDFAAEKKEEVENYLTIFKANYWNFLIHDAVECSFGFTTLSFIGNLYFCDVVNSNLEIEFHFSFGEHLEGKFDSDVNAFVLKNSQLVTFPVDLQEIFTNLKGIEITNSPLVELPENSFDNLTDLISIDLSNNKIYQIFPGTFKNNFKLISMDFSNNNLAFIASDIFDNKILRKVDFSENKCIDETAIIDHEIQDLKEEIENLCKNQII